MTEVKGAKGEILQKENPLGVQEDPTWVFNPNVQFGEDINENAFDWGQFFQGTANHSIGFLDTRHGEAFTQGFKDENFVAMAIDAYLNPPAHFVSDPFYNVVDDDDEIHRQLYLRDKDFFSQATSHAHFEHLIQKRKEQMALMETGGAYMFGRVFGGVADAGNIFLTSRLATPIYQSSRIKRTIGTTKVLGVEEFGKQLIDEDRTWQEGATVLGANAIINMLLPRFKGFTREQMDAIETHMRHSDLVDDTKSTLTAPNIKIVEGPTQKYRNNNPESHLYGKTIILKEGEKAPKGWEEIGARVNTKDGVTTIFINREKIALDFENKVWTQPKVKGVLPLKKDTFKSVEEYTDFVIKHEKAHTYIKQNKGETKGAYENRINEIALRIVKGKTSVPTTQYNYNQRKEYQQDHAKYLEELENETFKETILRSWGESSNMNPIQRLVNSGDLDAIKFGNAILGISHLTKGNFKGNANVQSLEKWLLADNKVYGNTILEVEKIYKKYKQGTSDRAISFKEFKQRVSLSLINSEYVDSIPAVMSAKKSIRGYYDYVGKKIKDSEIRINEQEMLIGSLQKRLANSKGKNVTLTARTRDGTKSVKKYTKDEFKKIIDDEIKLLEKWKKNPLRKDYLNRFVNRGKINDNIEAYRSFAKASLTRTNPTFPSEVIDDLVRQYEESFPWKQFERMNLEKSADDVIIEKYFFTPSTYSKNLKRRGNFVLDHEEWMKAGYMESDAFILMNVYQKSVLPDTYLGAIFGTADTMGGAFLAKKGYQAGLRDIAENYTKRFNEAKTVDEKAKIIEQRDKVLKDMEAVRDLFKGVYGVPPDPTQFWSRGIRLIKHFNAWTSLTGAMASVVDLGRSVFFNGMQRSLGATWESFTNGMSKKIYAISLKECRASGECFDMLLNTRAMSYNDLDTVYGNLDKIERGANKVSSVFFMANFMSPWNQMIKQHNTMLITTRILEECENLVNGKITKLNKAKLAQSGINEDDAHAIMQQYINHGQGKGSYKNILARNDENLKDIRLAKSYEWFNEDIAKKFQLAVQNDLRLSIVTPSKADTPLWMSTEVGGLVAQFKKFSMAMTNKVLIRGLQEKDANFYGGVIMMIALGMIIDRLRAKAFDSNYDSLSEAEKFKRGFERSGVGGIFTDVYNSVERLIYGDMGQKMGAVGGPTGSQLDKIQHILFSDDPSVQASNVRRMWPYNNISYADGFFDQLEESIK